MPRLLYLVTHAQSAGLIAGQLSWMRKAGYQVGLVASPGPKLDLASEREGVEAFPIQMAREIDPLADLRAVRRLTVLMRRWRPDVVNAGTPKAGLLGMLAARLTGVPVRIYTLRGLRLETTSGVKRAILATTERVASACAHQVISVSHSLAERYVELGLTPVGNIRVLGSGASNGVRVERFAAPEAGAVAALRKRLALPETTPVVGFVGRFTRDKGIGELVEAFEQVRAAVPEARLLLVGDFEMGDPVSEAVVAHIHSDPAIVQTGFLNDSAPAYALMDVLAFPSHREGFPNVPLEAAAAGLPVVGFDSTGTVDAVVDGATGTLVEQGDVDGLASSILRYLQDDNLRKAHGRAGQQRARKEFQPERIWKELLKEYDRLLAEAGRPRINGAIPSGSSEA